MRLKQLPGVLLLLVATALAAAGAGSATTERATAARSGEPESQLTNISVAGQGSATTVTLQASGAFTHTEYRPTDNLLLVDLAGVAAGKLKDSAQRVNRPGVESFRVVSYTGSNGSEVTRVEMKLNPRAAVTVSEAKDGLRLTVEPQAGSTAATPSADAPAQAIDAATASKPAEVKREMASAHTPHPAAKPITGKLVLVRHVSVARASGGMDVEIAASAPVKPSVMKLSSPDRVVVDIPDSMPVGRQRPILVNGPDVKAVRVARYQEEPPVTRVVVDLAREHHYEVVPAANKVILKLRSASRTATTAKAAEGTPATPAVNPGDAKSAAPITVAEMKPPALPANSAPADKPAQDYVFIAPNYQPKPEGEAGQPKLMAASAAKVLRGSADHKPEIITMPPVSAAPAVNLAQEQQQPQAAPPAAQPQAPATQPAAPAQPQAMPPQAGQPPAGQRYTGEPISVNLKDVDLKDFFRLIHEISGLNIVLDPNVKGTLTLVLDDVPWDQALDIVLQNNGLDRRLEGNVLRIATRETFTREAEARRAQAEAQALAVDPAQYTHYLSYAHAADLVPLVKRFLTSRGDVLSDPRTNALLIKDIPSVIPEVQRLLAQLDRKTQEVEIEARVVAATRNFARDIGTQLGFGWGNGPSAVGGASAVGTSPITFNLPNPQFIIGPGAGQIPLFSNLAVSPAPTSGISFTNGSNNYRIDAILTMAESRGLLKILSRPRVVTQNNIGATVKQGVRIPVVTQAQLGGPPTTTYIEAALRLQVTPQVTAENTIFLNVDVENTTPDFSRSVQGNPTLITQQATTSVLVTDGGTVVIGGVIQTQNSVNVTQVPLLGDIPVLGNLFKRRSISTSTQELIFFITPKIVQT